MLYKSNICVSNLCKLSYKFLEIIVLGLEIVFIKRATVIALFFVGFFMLSALEPQVFGSSFKPMRIKNCNLESTVPLNATFKY